VSYSHPGIVYVPIPELVPEHVCLAAAASRTSQVVDDCFAAAESTAAITAEFGICEMWQLASNAVLE
jgi:hypothetical protein